ncbi:peptidoglycan D,D-transpeptidase FtsI family protein [Erythrobacter donghaensis]|jgi:cell division protein FtsI (penicillin-binding protein 3)|uniref:peptidoglycan D,D-transpeptidase FtsI family protein n=1 Tax=Erythrobacter donghaensis TaxID=267135 RepID=UPI0009C05CBE|nr:penicillin-binding protein 2 [Erythrobacter donghaensis]
MNALTARMAVPLASVHTAIPAGRLPSAGLRAQMLWSARLRVLWLLGGFGAVALIALLRIATLGLGGNAPERTSLEEALLPPRGEITDRNGAPLARAFPAYAMWYNPKAMGDNGSPLVRSPAEVARALKAIFPDIDEARMARRLASGQAGYLRRRLLPEEANRVFALGEIALEIPRETDRYYPQGTLAAHVLGYVVEDKGGRIGMEEVLEKDLSHPDKRMQPVALSIDVRVQGALEDELRRGMLATNALGAAGIVLDVETGEVMAMASLPEFDPNTAGAAGAVNVFNRATNGVYELGSTFKPLTVAAAIDAGVVRDLGRQWNAAPVPVGSRTIKDSHPLGPSLNVPQALVHSSNTVTARVADEMGAERLRRSMIDLGMDRRPFIELPAKGKPIWPQGNWSRVTNMTVGFGHGLAVTPLHLASAYAAMVNGGIWRPATLMKLAPADVPRGRRVFKESTSSRMRQLLRMISLYGTGKSADAPGYRVGGKTGSAEKAGVGGYNKTALVSSFAAAFPMDAPRYVVVVVVDEPKGTMASSFQRTAAFTSAPIVGKLVPRIGPMLGVQPDESRDVDISDLRYLVDKGQ